jgi:GR25 family glycosyltransferase involved in LPS biosynthesis
MGKIDNYTVKVINLDSRTERMKDTLIELANFGFTHVYRFPAITGGESGCAKSHYECLKGKGPLFVFEDDVVFEPETLDRLNASIDQLPDDFDLLYLGANVKTPAISYSENLFQITGGTHTTHAMLWSAKGRARMLELWSPYVDNEYKQIDHWLFMTGQKLLNCFVVYPMIAYQRAAHSDIRNGFYDYRQEMLDNQMNNMKR